MQNRTDAELLQEYAAHHSEAAFSEIVRRYADVVYSAALRQVRNEQQARDVSQTVFVDLARKAVSLRSPIVLIGWLHRGARLAALELLRGEQRRVQRERQAMELTELSETSGDWSAIRPVLDEAIAELGSTDRDALLLRFFKNESLATVGATLGVSEDAAQKRVSRALDRLREFLAARGIKTTTAALSVTLAANSIQSAPTGFALSLASGALIKAAAEASATPFLKYVTLSNMKTAVLSLALIGSLAGIALVRSQGNHALRESHALAQSQADELEALRKANEQLAAQSNELATVRSDARDVLRLRGELARLRRELAEKKPAASVASNAEPAKASEFNELLQITIKARMISIPATTALPSSATTGLLTGSQLKMFMDSLKKTEGVEFISEANITTLNGRPVQMQISPEGAVAKGGTMTLDVMPVCRTGSRTINLDFSIGSETLVNLPANDLPPDGSTTATEARSLQVTNGIAIPDGQTLTLIRSMATSLRRTTDGSDDRGAEPRNLLILLTPTLIDPAGNRLFADDELSVTEGESTNAPGAQKLSEK